MMTPKVHKQILEDFLIRGSSDILQYSELRQAASEYLTNNASNDQVLEAVVNVVLDMVDSGYAIVGPIKRNTQPLEIVPLVLPRATLSELLFAVYTELGNPPEIWGAIWVELTEAGRASAQTFD